MPKLARRAAAALALVVSLAPIAASPAAASDRFDAPVVLQAATARLAGSPQAAVGASGQVAVTWMQQLRGRGMAVVVRRGRLDGRFGRRQVLDRAGLYPVVAAAGDGRPGAAVAWVRQHGDRRSIVVAIAPGAGRFGAPQTLEHAGGLSPFVLLVAARGRYVAFWQQSVDGRPALRYALTRADGRFGSPQTLAPAVGPNGGVSAQAAPDGSVIAAWGTPVDLTAHRNQQLAVATLPADATAFGPAQAVAAAAADQGAEIDGALVSSGPGGAALSWTEAGQLPELLRVAPVAGGTAGAPQTVLAVDSRDVGRRFGTTPQLALPGAGLPPVAAWAIVDAAGGDAEAIAGGRVFAAVAQPNGTFSDPQQLSAPGTIAANPAAGATATQTIVTWTTGAFPRYGLAYAVRPGGRPFVAGRLPGAVRAERPPVLAASATGAALVWTTHPGRSRDPQGGGYGIAVALLR